jgi:hypothetical protein
MKRILAKCWPICVIFILWLCVFSPYFFRGSVPFPSTYLVTFFPPWNASYGMPVKNNAMPDTISQIYPWKKLTIDSWKSGAIPLWNPYSFSGTTHAANYQSAVFSPFNLLFFVFPFVDAWSVLIALQPVIAGIGMYVFLRGIERSRVAATIASIAFMFCGFMTTWMAYGTLGYAAGFLPWALWAVSHDFRKKSFFHRLVIVLSIALSFVSGHFQISLYVFAAVFFYILYKGFAEKNLKEAGKLLGYVILGLLLVTPQLFLTFDGQSTRSASFIKPEVIPWQYLVTLFVPDFYGNPVTRNDWFGHYAEWASYIGIVPLVFSFLSFGVRNKKERIFFMMLVIGSLLLAYPTPLNDLLFTLKIPAISTSAASRIMILFSFALCVLSGFGFDDLTGYWNKKSPKEMVKTILLWVIGLSILWVTILILKPFAIDKLLIAKRNSILPSVFVVVTLLLLLLGFLKNKWIRVVVIFGLVSLSFFDSYRYVSKWMPFDPKDLVYPAEKSLMFLSSKVGEKRVFGNIGNEVGSMFRLPLIEGYDAMYQGRYAEFINAVSGGHIEAGDRSVVQFNKYGIYKFEALQLLGVSYIYHRLSDGRNAWAFPYWEYTEDGTMKQVYNDEKYWIYENTKAYPRAFLASDYVYEANDDKIIETLFAPDFDRRESLILEKKPITQPEKGEGIAEIVSYRANRVVIKTQSSVPKLLFLSDVFDPGWTALVDGKKTQVYRANYDFRAVEVPAGAHEVIFEYFPFSMRLGLLVSAFAVVLLVLSIKLL